MPMVPAFVATPIFTQIPGATPQTHPPVQPVTSAGQLYINGADGKVWVSAQNPGPPNPATGLIEPPFLWRQIGIDSVPPWDPQANYATGDLVYRPGTGTTPGQVYRAKQDVGPGQMPPEANTAMWEPVGAPAAGGITISNTVGQNPTNTPVTNPQPGHVFINRPDGKVWIFGPDPAGGTGFVWEPLPASRGTVTYITDQNPGPPITQANYYGFGVGATVNPNPTTMPPEPGDVWFNPITGDMGVFT